MMKKEKVLLFSVSSLQFALAIDFVEYVLPAMTIYPYDANFAHCIGGITFQEQVIPVFDPCNHLNLKKKEMELEDKIIIWKKEDRLAALLVNDVKGVFEIDKRNGSFEFKNVITSYYRIEELYE